MIVDTRKRRPKRDPRVSYGLRNGRENAYGSRFAILDEFDVEHLLRTMADTRRRRPKRDPRVSSGLRNGRDIAHGSRFAVLDEVDVEHLLGTMGMQQVILDLVTKKGDS
ncbi:hypothetical protein V6N12_045386 [Hibiscus sabdariffa]|uniref:Uncharacterized protein n=1 Tax=Hibiscus sabdariffa TaxID=183260 RepID=A0ABR2G347_9ROSI